MTGKNSKKRSRKGGAPLESAKSYKKGDKKKGTDGRLYYVNKGHRWSKVASSSTSKHKRGGLKKGTPSEKRRWKRYETRYNGIRPFIVSLDGTTAEVYENIDEEALVYTTKYERAFVGKGKKNGTTRFSEEERRNGKEFDGNTILLHLGGKRYVYIGERIASFSAKDEIVSYESPIGLSPGGTLLPLPFATDRSKNVYLFTENVLLPNPPLRSLDPYEFLYTLIDGAFAGSATYSDPAKYLDLNERLEYMSSQKMVSFFGKTIVKNPMIVDLKDRADESSGIRILADETPGVPVRSRKGGAPTESAKSYKKGDKKKGTDGRLYYVNKGHRWSKVASSSRSGSVNGKRTSGKRRGKRYETHDNGGRPFAVYLDGSTAEVVRLGEDGSGGEDGEEEKVVYKTRYEKAFVGKSKEHGKIFDGNTILLHLGGKKYVYTGEKVVSFSAKDEIVSYESPVGNSDVPYPFAIDRSKNVYLFAENVLLSDPPLEKERNGSVDPYSFYYGFSKDGGMAGLDKEERDRVNPVSFLGKTIQKRRFGPDYKEGVEPGVPIKTKRKGGRRRRRSTTLTKRKRRRSRPATRTTKTQGRT